MIDDFEREQAALYALDALPADEAAKFRDLVRQNPDLADLVAAYESAGALLAETAPPLAPPPELRGRILAAVTKTPIAAAEVETASRSGTSGRVIPWGIAAALAIATGVLWMQNQRLDEKNVALAGQAAAVPSLEHELAALKKRNALAEMQVATLTSKLDGSYLASIAWDNSAQEGILKVRRLPAAERGKDYQLWVIDPNNAVPVSAGVFTVANDGSATIRFSPAQPVSSASAFAVSLEKSGGAPAPAGPIVLTN
ncbi:MAG TPA: anti-sigma factor [Chthoniobacterales bacterium]|jgi:anti-sigma-K factor RskA